jgi:hypothetical protein
MKPHLNLIWKMTGLAAVTAAAKLMAADATTTYSVNAAQSYAPRDYSRSTPIASSTSNAAIVVLNAQAFLLKEMLHEHQSRAADLKQKNESDKAKWETELVSELQEKSARVQKSIDAISQPVAAARDLKGASGEVDDGLIFLATVDARLEQIHQELSAAIEDSRVLSTQVATNKAPEDIGAMAGVLSENQRLVKDLEKEQLDLELRILEFRAIRKGTQK